MFIMLFKNKFRGVALGLFKWFGFSLKFSIFASWKYVYINIGFICIEYYKNNRKRKKYFKHNKQLKEVLK